MQTSSEENEVLTDWVSKSRQNEEIFKEIKEVWEISKPQEVPAHTLEVLNRIKEKVDNPLNKERNFRIQTWWFSAAVLLTGIFIFLLPRSGETPLLTALNTHGGEIKTVTLSDGTIVHLAPKSILKYPPSFKGALREVSLQGEAYFEVTKNSHQPFAVHSGKVVIKVLGTVFNVSANKTQPSIEVSLVEGRVEVSNEQDPENRYLLAPGQRLVYAKKEDRFYRNTFEKDEVTGWMEHNLMIRNESLLSAAEKIERMYDVKIVFEDQEITQSHLFATFKNKPLKYVLETIKTAANIGYHQEGKIIYLSRITK